MSSMTSLFLFLSSLAGAFALQCYICGDAGLDEFGECSSQFQYDCNDYARRFPPTEKIYCRSTRTRNSTSSEFL
ncbi:hypothetical protein B9Z55_004309 [Caenorhabditis nigoni]|uniref:Secreted protein n=1 Tax=Caenorhabditis nigoni TaxID=1611254 RepID=A0A2G5UVS2_9PELO|nr:hypothetical protein B9Z55_004309 [Caenorhabditis nigoni]